MNTLFKKIGITLLVIIAVLGVVYVASNKGGVDGGVVGDATDLAQIAVDMEKDLGVKDVMIFEVEGNILEVRVEAPDSADKEVLTAGAAYMFGYLESVVSKDMKKIRIVYTRDNLDTSIFEAVLSDISLWKNNELDDAGFATKIKNVDLKN